MKKLSVIQGRILSVAEEQFRTAGYSQTTMDHLAELLGMSKKTLYENFRSKEQIAEVIINNLAEAIGKVKHEVMQSEANAVEKLFQIGQGIQKCLLTLASPKLLGDLKRNAPELWEKVRLIRNERIRTIWSHLLDEGVKKGYFRKNFNTELFIVTLMRTTEYLLDGAALEYSGEDSYVKMRRDMLDIFLNGILTEKGRDVHASYQ